jgi:CBS domain-containing protein
VTSVLLGIGFGLALQVAPAGAPVLVFTLGFLAILNVILAVFNLLPAFPMDGGRIPRALLARNRPYASATRIAARIGVVFALLFVVLGALNFEIIILLVGLFIYAAATTESRTVVLEELLTGITVRTLASTDATVSVEDSAADLMDRLLRARRTDLLVRDGGEIVGVVTAESLRSVAPADYEATTIGDLVETDLPRLDADLGAFEALIAMNQSRSDVALVEDEGRLVGAISQSDFAAALDLQRGSTPA